MNDSGFPRTPDRLVKSLGTHVRYLRSIETSMGAHGPDSLGGSTTPTPKCITLCTCVSIFSQMFCGRTSYLKNALIPAVAEPPKKSGPCAPIDVSTDLRLRTQVPNNLTGLSGVLGKPKSSMNLFQTGSQSQSL